MRSARKIGGDPTVTGTGVLDIAAALAETGTTESAPSPRLARSEESDVILIEDTARLWGGAEWGAAYLWNDAVQNDDLLLAVQGATVVLNND